MRDVESSLSWLERERLLSRALLMLTSTIFALAKIITPWGLFDAAAVLVFMALAFAAVRAHRRVEQQQRSGHGVAPRSILVAAELDLIAVGVIGLFIIWANLGFPGRLHRVALILGALAVAVASFRGSWAYFAVWRRIRGRLPAVVEYSWGDLIDDEGPFSSRAPKDPSREQGESAAQKDLARRARKRRKVRR